MHNDSNFTVVIAYVDDLSIIGNNLSTIQHLKDQLHQAFTIKHLGALRYFMGIEITRYSSGILLNQRKYILNLLKNCFMENCSSAIVPLPN